MKITKVGMSLDPLIKEKMIKFLKDKLDTLPGVTKTCLGFLEI